MLPPLLLLSSLRRPSALLRPLSAVRVRALVTSTSSTTSTSRRRRESVNNVVVGCKAAGRAPTAAAASHILLAQPPRRALAAAAAAGANPIKAKIMGSLIEARDKGVPVEVGMDVELEHTFGPEGVKTFAELSGDDNPIHLDHAYATKQGIFKGAIVHGLLVGSLFGTIFGVTFPGCVYLQQSFKFSRPVYVGRPVTAVVEVTRRREREGSSPPSSVLFCSTHVIDEEGVAAIAGEAVVMLVHKEKDKDKAGAEGGGK